MAIIYDDEHLQVIHAPGNSSFAVVTFNTRDQRANGRTFWGDVLHDKYGLECFGFASKAANWYPAPSMRAASQEMARHCRKPLIGYGHSMGGYAALKYSRLLDLAGAVAQCSADHDRSREQS